MKEIELHQLNSIHSDSDNNPDKSLKKKALEDDQNIPDLDSLVLDPTQTLQKPVDDGRLVASELYD